MTPSSVLSTIKQLSRGFIKTPFLTWRFVWAKIEQRTGFPSHIVSPSRLYIRWLEKRNIPHLPHNHYWVLGNYILDKRMPLDRNSIIYSAGVGVNISFDKALHDATGASIHMIDPTPRSAAYLKSQNLPDSFILHPVALFDHDGEVSFFPDFKENDLNASHSFSIHNRSRTQAQIKVPCLRFSSLMKKNGDDHVDLFKLDIEGVGDTVLETLLDDEIYPAQIVGEFEMPAHPLHAIKTAYRLLKLFSRLEQVGYHVYSITNAIYGARYEIVATRPSS